jgi:flagellar biosynthesis protein FliP
VETQINELKYNQLKKSLKKNYGVSFLLTFLFGPLGLFYSSFAIAIIFLIISVIVGFATMGFGLMLIWPMVIILGLLDCFLINRRVDKKYSSNI